LLHIAVPLNGSFLLGCTGMQLGQHSLPTAALLHVALYGSHGPYAAFPTEVENQVPPPVHVVGLCAKHLPVCPVMCNHPGTNRKACQRVYWEGSYFLNAPQTPNISVSLRSSAGRYLLISWEIFRTCALYSCMSSFRIGVGCSSSTPG
jgi:hypothetical protein